MAKPRIFVSSTYYDLKHVRSSLEHFIEGLGFEPVLSEKGDIAFLPELPLDESCYREAGSADIFVLIVGGRYGSEASGKQKKPTKAFYERYDSISKKEYESAITREVPIYVLIENDVYSEYHTYLRNRDNNAVDYAHVDSVNVFKLIEEILSKSRNNPVHTFERFSDIETWLREQWAGLFRELLQRKSQQQQLTTLTLRVSELKEINETLRKYLEAVMNNVGPKASKELVESERKRLAEAERNEQAKASEWWHVVDKYSSISIEAFVDAVRDAKTFDDFVEAIERAPGRKLSIIGTILRHLVVEHSGKIRFNNLRVLLNAKPLFDLGGDAADSEQMELGEKG